MKRIFLYFILLIGIVWLIYRVYTGKTPLSMDTKVIGAWISAFLTLAIFSFLYKDNPLYKLSEHIFVGISAAYVMVSAFWSNIMMNCLPKIIPDAVHRILPDTHGEKDYVFLIPLLLGLMLLLQLTKRYAWVSKLTLAYIIGYSAGLNFIAYLVSDFTTQIRSSIVPLIVLDGGAIDWGATFSAIVLVTGLIASLCYFYFSKEHKGMFGRVSRYGVMVLMITFGTSFAFTVMGRIALLIGRSNFILRDWLHVID